jgi:hypothetical protein
MSMVAVYHMLKFGFKGFITIFATASYIIISLSIVSFLFFFINEIDWGTKISIFDKGIAGEMIIE